MHLVVLQLSWLSHIALYSLRYIISFINNVIILQCTIFTSNIKYNYWEILRWALNYCRRNRVNFENGLFRANKLTIKKIISLSTEKLHFYICASSADKMACNIHSRKSWFNGINQGFTVRNFFMSNTHKI